MDSSKQYFEEIKEKEETEMLRALRFYRFKKLDSLLIPTGSKEAKSCVILIFQTILQLTTSLCQVSCQTIQSWIRSSDNFIDEYNAWVSLDHS